MPFARVTLSGIALAPARREELARRVTETMRDALGTPYRLTAVCVEELPGGSWTVGWQVAQRGAAHVEATVSAGTKTDEQKAAFIVEIARVIEEFCGPLPEPTYVVVRELPPSAWGFGGSTIAARSRTPRAG
jgi:4-oxalocrotonate tautomerase